jgi:cell division protein FtsB
MTRKATNVTMNLRITEIGLGGGLIFVEGEGKPEYFFVAASGWRLRDSGSSTVTLRSLAIAFFILLSIASAAVVGVFFYNAQQEYGHLKAIQAENTRQLQEAEAHLKEQQKVLERLQTDPSYVERVIRRKLEYAKPDESIYRFDE